MIDGHIFVAIDGHPNQVHCYNEQGKKLVSWNHSDMKGCWASNLAIIGNQIAMLDKAGHRIVLYTLTGELIKSIPCGVVRGRWASICVADEDCVIISVHETSTVAKLNISTGSMVWVHEGFTGAQGVTCYKGQYVLVASEGLMTNITVLNLQSGSNLLYFNLLSMHNVIYLTSCIILLMKRLRVCRLCTGISLNVIFWPCTSKISCISRTLYFLVSFTGASVAQLASMSCGRGTQLKSCVFSLCMTDDDLLVVPRYADKEICYYKLVTQDN